MLSEDVVWIVYDKTRIKKNKSFVLLLQQEFFKFNIKANLVFAEDVYNYQDFPKLAIMRSDFFECSKFLESKGVRICNNSFVTEICNDKYKTYLYLKEKGIKVVETFLKDEIANLKFPYVAKSRFGHGGSEVFLIKNEKEKDEILKKYPNNVLIFQPLCDVGIDKRNYVINNNVVVTMLRSNNNDFRANFSLGGHAEKSSLNNNENLLLNQVLQVFNFDYVGIDLIYKDNEPFINEIEDIVGCRMVFDNTNIDLVNIYVKYLVSIITKKK